MGTEHEWINEKTGKINTKYQRKHNGSWKLWEVLSLKELEILYQERRGQAKSTVMEHFNGIKSGPANKKHTYQ